VASLALPQELGLAAGILRREAPPVPGRRVRVHVLDAEAAADAAHTPRAEPHHHAAPGLRLRSLNWDFGGEGEHGALPNAMRYFSKLPRTPLGAARHLLRVRRFPADLLAQP